MLLVAVRYRSVVEVPGRPGTTRSSPKLLTEHFLFGDP